jgi:hypothetical protein
MYDPIQVLAAIDAHKWNIIALCGVAMLANYAYFISAVRQGFRDQTYPFPIFCTMFWLVGDASMVLSYDLCFNVYNHWYLKLFWGALCFTVMFELFFLYMILKFGRKELEPTWTQGQFNLLIGAGLLVAIIVWAFVKQNLHDPLFIIYFDLANMAGPMFFAANLIRRGSTQGTNALIWWCYVVLVASWSLACALWFGAPFDSPLFLALYAVTTAATAAVAVAITKMAARERSAAASLSAAAPMR